MKRRQNPPYAADFREALRVTFPATKFKVGGGNSWPRRYTINWTDGPDETAVYELITPMIFACHRIKARATVYCERELTGSNVVDAGSDSQKEQWEDNR